MLSIFILSNIGIQFLLSSVVSSWAVGASCIENKHQAINIPQSIENSLRPFQSRHEYSCKNLVRIGMHQPLAIATFSPKLSLTRSQQSNRSLSLCWQQAADLSPLDSLHLSNALTRKVNGESAKLQVTCPSQVSSWLSHQTDLSPPCPPPSSCRRRAVHHVGDDWKALTRPRPAKC